MTTENPLRYRGQLIAFNEFQDASSINTLSTGTRIVNIPNIDSLDLVTEHIMKILHHTKGWPGDNLNNFVTPSQFVKRSFKAKHFYGKTGDIAVTILPPDSTLLKDTFMVDPKWIFSILSTLTLSQQVEGTLVHL